MSDMSEEWRDVEGYEGMYQVSCRGRVKSLDRYIKHSSGGSALLPGRILKPVPNNDGYLRVSLSIRGQRTFFSVHALVCAAFIGPRPDGMDIRHLNGDSLYNCVENLVYGTSKENYADMLLHGTVAPKHGEHNGRAKLTETDVRKIRRMLGEGLYQREIADMFGVHQSQISCIKLRRSWSHLDPKPAEHGGR